MKITLKVNKMDFEKILVNLKSGIVYNQDCYKELKKGMLQSPQNLIDGFNYLYDAIVSQGSRAFANIDEYNDACEFAVNICIVYDDYVKSNNILQCYRNSTTSELKAWYYLFSIIVYGYRNPFYFINKPDNLIDKINKCNKNPDVDEALLKVFKHYSDLYTSSNEETKQKIINFFKYIKSKYFDLKTNCKRFLDKVDSALNFLQSENQDLEFSLLTPSNDALNDFSDVSTILEKKEDIEIENIDDYDDVYQYLSTDIEKSKIYILGFSKMKRKDIESVCKSCGYEHGKMYTYDYSEMSNFDIKKLEFNTSVSAIIIGEQPHSVKGINGYSSLCSYLEANKNKYPPFRICKDANGNLKMTKTSLKENIEDILRSYKLLSKTKR